MELRQFERTVKILNDVGVRYIVVGGFAIILRGLARFTTDLDIVLELTPDSTTKAVTALRDAGFLPKNPVDPLDFADPAIRSDWVKNRNMIVFRWHDPTDPLFALDVFVSEPFPFDEMYARTLIVEFEGLECRIAADDDMIALKLKAARPKDFRDIDFLEFAKEEDERTK